jgi:hypothetical protein
MRKFVLSAIAITTLAAVSIPAQADMYHGPTKNGSQCFVASPGAGGKDGVGYWSACPQAASTVAAAPKHRRHAAR